MKRFLPISIFLAFFITSSSYGQFQAAQVVKSEQKVIYQNKVYFVHTVQPNQTLYSIGKAYEVRNEEIAAANPDINLDVLKPGMVLKIPDNSVQVNQEPENSRRSRQTKNEGNFIYHTIEPQQTLYFLTKKYNISEEEIIKYNPEARTTLSVGQVIKIPKTRFFQKNFGTITEQDTIKTYTVKEGDTLYSIAQLYNVSVAAMVETNPDLRLGLKSGMILRIPGKTTGLGPLMFNDTLMVADSRKLYQYTQSKCDSFKARQNNNTMKIVLMMPFHANELVVTDTSQIDSTINTFSRNKQFSIGANCIEYYEGLLLALDSLKETGRKISLFTFDTGSDTTKIRKIINELAIIKPDIIIGPVKTETIAMVSEYSKANKVPLILPFTKLSGSGLTGNPYIFSMIPDTKTELDNYAKYLSKFTDQNILIVHHTDTNVVNSIHSFKKSLFAYSQQKYGKTPAHYKEIPMNDTLQKCLMHSMRRKMNNIIFITSGNEAYVVNLIGLFYIQSDYYSIKVLGLPSWQKFNNLRAEQVHKVGTVLYSPFYIDYTKPQTMRFIARSRNNLGFEPARTTGNSSGYNNTYLGYETALIFVDAFFTYGNNFANCACLINKVLPQSNYTFKENAEGGFSNNSINIMEFTKEFDVKLLEN